MDLEPHDMKRGDIHTLEISAKQSKAATFRSKDAAIHFAGFIAAELMPDRVLRTHAQRVGEEFVAQVCVSRNIIKKQGPSELMGTILVDAMHKPFGLSFLSYTDECDSGHDFAWIEDFSGNTLSSGFVPR